MGLSAVATQFPSHRRVLAMACFNSTLQSYFIIFPTSDSSPKSIFNESFFSKLSKHLNVMHLKHLLKRVVIFHRRCVLPSYPWPQSLRPLRHPPVKSRPSQTHPEDENLMGDAYDVWLYDYVWLMTWSWLDPDFFIWKHAIWFQNYKGLYRLGLGTQQLENNLKKL